ncbi:hypothetical protein GWI33_003369 [Rhynchophorus ferrugineus]|uniref:Uncharacterized protein n=1 Tax=Rhynchophorus ferrugineus TaxID=354439 RepID=A0A834MM24_RHYFE|nr:hypothetical protein GWI33_003369 [Rhynchophorus ferrugineus]
MWVVQVRLRSVIVVRSQQEYNERLEGPNINVRSTTVQLVRKKLDIDSSTGVVGRWSHQRGSKWSGAQ